MLLCAGTARAVILYGTGDPTANTTAPTGALAGSGWQYEGQFGAYLGTPIGSNYFITAGHIGGASLVGTAFVYQGTSYTTTAAYKDPNSDLCIYKVNGTFTSIAPLYTKPGGEVGLQMTVFGRGTQRGSDVIVGDGANQHVGGWLWGSSDSVERWGTNTVSQIVTDPTLGPLVYATFDASGGPNEATLSAGDSGGGVFVQDTDGQWKLAGINYGVDDPFYRSATGSGGFYGAMFDTTGLYEDDGMGGYVTANNPAGMYASEIAGDLGFIDGVVPEPSSGTLLGLGAGISLVAWRLSVRHRRGQPVRLH